MFMTNTVIVCDTKGQNMTILDVWKKDFFRSYLQLLVSVVFLAARIF